jgi:hypothetical protein
MQKSRRSFVSSGLVLAGVAAGTVTGLNSAAALDDSTGQANPRLASFGWEVTNLNNNGADIFLRAAGNLTLNSLSIDTAFMLTSTPSSPGFAEVLCRGAFSRGRPKFVHGDPGASFVSPASPNFGKVEVHNPNHLNVGFDGVVLQNIFYSVILKSWVPKSGTASSTSRHVEIAPLLKLNADDYLVFNMSHAGVPGDCEMQVVVSYTVG